MNYDRIVLVRHPTVRVWRALRDELPAIGTFMSGIAAIRRLERRADDDDMVHTVHEWTARANLPRSIEQRADADALAWIERTAWDGRRFEARWTVESKLLGRSLVGAGTTRLTSAMGGHGTRVKFDVSANLEAATLGPLGAEHWSAGITNAAAGVLAKTLQDLCVALEQFLERRDGTRARELPRDAT